MENLKEATIKRYTHIYKRLVYQNQDLEKVKDWNLKQFERNTGLKGKGQFSLCKSLARNPYIQKAINKHIKKEKLITPVLQPIEVKPYFKKELIQKEIISYTKYQELKKEGSYGIAEVRTSEGIKWIKYADRTNYNRQLDIIKNKYPKIKKIIFYEIRQYTSFVDKKFKKLLRESDIEA